MRAVLADLVREAEVLAGSAEAIPRADSSVDAVFVADAFHWFGTREVVAELARVLCPRGTLGLLWFGRSVRFEPPLPDAFTRRIRQLREAAPKHPHDGEGWRSAFDGGLFEPLRRETFTVEHTADRDAMVAQAISSSFIASLTKRKRESVRGELLCVLSEANYRTMVPVDLEWTRLSRSNSRD